MNGCHKEKIETIKGIQTCTCEFFDNITGWCTATEAQYDTVSKFDGQPMCHLKSDAVSRIEWETGKFDVIELREEYIINDKGDEESELDKLDKELDQLLAALF